jgi:hypothetical protein
MVQDGANHTPGKTENPRQQAGHNGDREKGPLL